MIYLLFHVSFHIVDTVEAKDRRNFCKFEIFALLKKLVERSFLDVEDKYPLWTVKKVLAFRVTDHSSHASSKTKVNIDCVERVWVTQNLMPSSIPFAIGLLSVLFILGSILPSKVLHFPVCLLEDSAELQWLFKAERRRADSLILLIFIFEQDDIVYLRLVLVVLTDPRASSKDFTWEYKFDKSCSALFSTEITLALVVEVGSLWQILVGEAYHWVGKLSHPLVRVGVLVVLELISLLILLYLSCSEDGLIHPKGQKTML